MFLESCKKKKTEETLNTDWSICQIGFEASTTQYSTFYSNLKTSNKHQRSTACFHHVSLLIQTFKCDLVFQEQSTKPCFSFEV